MFYGSRPSIKRTTKIKNKINKNFNTQTLFIYIRDNDGNRAKSAIVSSELSLLYTVKHTGNIVVFLPNHNYKTHRAIFQTVFIEFLPKVNDRASKEVASVAMFKEGI